MSDKTPRKTWRQKLAIGICGAGGLALIGLGASGQYPLLAPVGMVLLAVALFMVLPPRKF